MVLRGRRVVEWVGGSWPGGSDQSTRRTPMVKITLLTNYQDIPRMLTRFLFGSVTLVFFIKTTRVYVILLQSALVNIIAVL
jgi:hypothetical protein